MSQVLYLELTSYFYQIQKFEYKKKQTFPFFEIKSKLRLKFEKSRHALQKNVFIMCAKVHGKAWNIE